MHYQSRAQVPAPCVGKPRRPPVLQVSSIQTPREGQGRRGGHRGGAPGATATRRVSLFLLCSYSSQPGEQARS